MNVLMFVLGVVVGYIVLTTVTRRRAIGSLRIDTSDPSDGPYLFLELSQDVSSIYNKKYVVLEVNTKNFISQE